MSSQNVTCKLPISGSECLCILDSEWTDSNIKLMLIHDNQAWNGMFQIEENEDVIELIDQLSLTEGKYMDETRKALTTHGGAEQFTYTLVNGGFTWKKFIRTNMAVKFGYVLLSKIPVLEAFDKIIDNSLQSSVKINERLSNTIKGINTLEEENLSLKTKLQNLIDKKNEMETILYSQFLKVLNAKKLKIEELEKKLGNNDIAESKPESSHHNMDPFNTDTELDSEDEEEKYSPLKLNIVKNKDTLEEVGTHTLPKRFRKFNNKEHILGTSRRNTKGSGAKKGLPTTYNKSTEKKRGARTSVRESCVLGMTTNDKDLNHSEDDAFTFPKRSKRSSKETKLVKPSTSKIKYDSDETYLENPDSESTPSDIDIVEKHTSVKKEIPDEIEARGNTIDHKTDVSKEVETQNNKNKPSMESSHASATVKGFSTSTLDILNKLV